MILMPIKPQILFVGQEVLKDLKTNLEFITADGEDLFFITDNDAPNKKVMRINYYTKRIEVLIPEDPQRLIQFVEGRGNKLIVGYLEALYTKVEVFGLNGVKLQRLNLRDGHISMGKSPNNSTWVYFKIDTWDAPPVTLTVNLKNLSKTTRRKMFGWNFNKTFNTTVLRESYESENGTKIPIWLMFHTKFWPVTSSHPVLMEVYGGFGVTIFPRYDPAVQFLIYNWGYVYAVPIIRGCGGYLPHWHDEGRKAKKQNSVDDVVAASQYLVKHNFTRAHYIALSGFLNGGLVALIAANQHPKSFGMVYAESPITDLLRFSATKIGHSWMPEYGNVHKKHDYEYLRRLSPLHNIPDDLTSFPAVFIKTSLHDKRVVPAHSLKYMAELQYLYTKNPKNVARSFMLAIDGMGEIRTTYTENILKACNIQKLLVPYDR